MRKEAERLAAGWSGVIVDRRPRLRWSLGGFDGSEGRSTARSAVSAGNRQPCAPSSIFLAVAVLMAAPLYAQNATPSITSSSTFDVAEGTAAVATLTARPYWRVTKRPFQPRIRGLPHGQR